MTNGINENNKQNQWFNAKKNQIIMVNSFKGGCGKTSISLSLCVTESIEYFKEKAKELANLEADIKRNRQIIYLDIDISGTAVEYSIYENGKSPTYMNMGKGIEEKTNIVEFNSKSFESGEKIPCAFKAMLLNPIARQNTSYTANITARKNSSSLDKLFLDKLINFLSDYVKNSKDFFIVLDCSPGFDDFEKSLIEEIHKIKKDNKKNDFDFIECFVTTLDKSHIQKTISSLRNVALCKVNLDERDICVIVNDLTDLNNWNEELIGRSSIEPESYLEKLCSYIKESSVNQNDVDKKIAEKSIFVISNTYDKRISEANLMFLQESHIESKEKNQICLENAPDAYTNNKLWEGVINHGHK